MARARQDRRASMRAPRPNAAEDATRRLVARRLAEIDLFNSVPALMRHVYRGLSRGMEQRTARYGISIGTWYFLRVLWEEDGLSQTELSERIGIVGPTTVIAVNRMVRDGLVLRRADASYGRKSRIFLTPKAKRLKARMLEEAADFVAETFATIPPDEVQRLRASLRKIARNLEPHLPASLFGRITKPDL